MKLLPSFVLLLFVVSVGCHRKMTVGKTTTTTTTTVIPTTTTHTASEPVKPLLDSTEAAGDVIPSAPTITAKPMIIVDARGNFAVKEEDLPPDASKSILNNANARAYTPAELKTLSYRYKQIPPRILYVPAALQKTSSRGTYYILLKKFYYWMKPDGYFYLDEHYYK